MKTRETELSDNSIIKTEEIIKSIGNKADGNRLESFLYTTEIGTLVREYPIDRTGLSQFMERGGRPCIRRSRLVHIPKISAIFALNRTRSAAKGTELNYFGTVITTSHRIFTFFETCYIERTNSNGTARNVSKSRFYLISRAPPKYFWQQKARQVESFLPRLEGGSTICYITG
jgi:hypothetical protein